MSGLPEPVAWHVGESLLMTSAEFHEEKARLYELPAKPLFTASQVAELMERARTYGQDEEAESRAGIFTDHPLPPNPIDAFRAAYCRTRGTAE